MAENASSSTSSTIQDSNYNGEDLLENLLQLLFGIAITALTRNQRAEIWVALTDILNSPKTKKDIIKLAKMIIEIMSKYGPIAAIKVYDVARWITMYFLSQMKKVFSQKPQRKSEDIEDERFAVKIDDENWYNVAVAGYTSNGKTTFINAIRGLRNWETDKGAAKTSPLENTDVITPYGSERYPRLRLYDIPGSNTTEANEKYFKMMNLDKFVSILIFCGELSLHDLKIVEMAQKCGKAKNIIFVRSKMDEFMRNKWRYDQGLDYPPTGKNLEAYNAFQERAAKDIEELEKMYQDKQQKHPIIKDIPIYFISSYSLLNALLQEPTKPQDLTEFLIYQEHRLVEKISELSSKHAGLNLLSN